MCFSMLRQRIYVCNICVNMCGRTDSNQKNPKMAKHAECMVILWRIMRRSEKYAALS